MGSYVKGDKIIGDSNVRRQKFETDRMVVIEITVGKCRNERLVFHFGKLHKHIEVN